jgi:hypothetical protein
MRYNLKGMGRGSAGWGQLVYHKLAWGFYTKEKSYISTYFPVEGEKQAHPCFLECESLVNIVTKTTTAFVTITCNYQGHKK